MAFSDSDFISKEKHELDYVLRKWNRRATQANRDMLIEALDRFRADDAQAPHTRKEFYEWADRNGLVGRLEAAGDEEERAAVAAAAAGDAAGDAAGKTRSKWPWWLWLIIAILVVLLILFILRSCGGCSAAGGQASGGNVAASAPATVAMPASSVSAAAATPAPAASETTTLEAAPAPAPVTLSLAGMPPGDLVVRFLPDSSDLAPGETARLAALVDAIRNLGADVGTLVVEGHSASVGYPEGELAVSEARARYVAGRLREAGLSTGIDIVASGRGAADMVAGPAELSRRVVISNR